jgi:hypothetical protein
MATTYETNGGASSAPRLPRLLRLHVDDNVAVALDDVVPGPAAVLGSGGDESTTAREPITRGHKLALRAINSGDTVRKYGVPIGFATQLIAAGAWVHTHNCRSGLDERSHTLDKHTGAPTDTKYI